jgi:predicted transposase/invertase (TIGR01784 family)
MRNDEVELSDNLRIIFIQMPLFKEEDKNEENLQNIEKWIIFLKDSTNKEKRDLLNRIINTDEGIKEAGEILMTISDDEREWAIQESIYKAEVDRQAELLATHDLGVEEGLEQGREEGLETAARGMKAKNIPIETIIEITGLTAEQVAAL